MLRRLLMYCYEWQFSRDLMLKAGGLQTLVGCVMSHDYAKRRYPCVVAYQSAEPSLLMLFCFHVVIRYGCMALANMALSVSGYDQRSQGNQSNHSSNILQVFASRGLMDRIIKMVERREIEMQREVVTLIRNLCCHGQLRPLLIERGAVPVIEKCLNSVRQYLMHSCFV
jgi:hypothetical protein